jgi:DNA (cytosine-5)-methyltransferase 1
MNTKLTMGSLFDGSGGFPLGGLLSGITPVWASEIEPFPIRVTSKRLPYMKHYGDISQMDGGKIEPVDIICFGSPCTDMSVAGRRAGLDGKQSVLFYQAIRIIKEMRCATNGQYPRWICWENVPGAFSSNSGHDFQAVLEAVIGLVEPDAQVPMPEKNRWPYADCYMGDKWSVAYRTLDCQYWGLPQRRKRIFLIGDLAGQCAADVLFKSEGLSGYSAESFRAWQRAAGGAENCTGITGLGLDGYNGTVSPVASTLGVNCGMSTGRNGVVLNDQGGNRMDVTHEVTCTLRAEAHHPPLVMDDPAVFENHSQDTRYTGPVDVAPTVSHQYGTGGNNQPFVVSEVAAKAFGISSKDSNGMKSANPHVGFYEAETVRTLDGNGGNPTCNQGGTAVVECPVYSMTTGSFAQVSEDMAPTVLARDYKDPTAVCYGIGRDTFNHSKTSPFAPTMAVEVQPTLVAKGPGAVQRGYTVRRLTPTECARLQGFPDWWCGDLATTDPTDEELTFWKDVWETHRRIVSPSTKPKTEKQIRKWLADPHSDAAEYKMWGNGVALPCVFFVLAGIVFYTQN